MENERPARRFRDESRTGGRNFGHEATLVIVASLSQVWRQPQGGRFAYATEGELLGHFA